MGGFYLIFRLWNYPQAGGTRPPDTPGNLDAAAHKDDLRWWHTTIALVEPHRFSAVEQDLGTRLRCEYTPAHSPGFSGGEVQAHTDSLLK